MAATIEASVNRPARRQHRRFPVLIAVGRHALAAQNGQFWRPRPWAASGVDNSAIGMIAGRSPLIHPCGQRWLRGNRAGVVAGWPHDNG